MLKFKTSAYFQMKNICWHISIMFIFLETNKNYFVKSLEWQNFTFFTLFISSLKVYDPYTWQFWKPKLDISLFTLSLPFLCKETHCVYNCQMLMFV